MAAIRGETHKFLGMKQMFRDRKFGADIANKVQETLDKFPIKFGKENGRKTPTGNELF